MGGGRRRHGIRPVAGRATGRWRDSAGRDVAWPNCATVLPTGPWCPAASGGRHSGGVWTGPGTTRKSQQFPDVLRCPRGRLRPSTAVREQFARHTRREMAGLLPRRAAPTAGMNLAYSNGVPMIRAKRLSTRSVRSAAAGSWIALVAATTLGDAADAVRAKVRADGLSAGRVYRLVVQSYDRQAGENPRKYARPIGSVQRSVTADELRDGVHVSLVEFRQKIADGAAGDPLILAWIDVGEPDLEFDGRMARPRAGSVYGVVKRSAGHDVVQISLNRKVAT